MLDFGRPITTVTFDPNCRFPIVTPPTTCGPRNGQSLWTLNEITTQVGARTACPRRTGDRRCKRDVPPPPEATNKSPEAAPPTERAVGPLSEADAAALATMNDRLKAYVELHKTVEDELPKVPKGNPQQIDQRQREFEKRLREGEGREAGRNLHAGSGAGNPSPARGGFRWPEGKQLLATVLDENPVGMKLAVNMRYPDEVPISTMPPRGTATHRSCLKTSNTDSSAAISSCSMRTRTSWRTSSSTPFPYRSHPMRFQSWRLVLLLIGALPAADRVPE